MTHRSALLPPALAVLVLVLLGLAAGALGSAPLFWTLPALLVAAILLAQLIAGLRQGRLGIDLIAIMAILGALALGQHLAAIIVATMAAGGAALEELAQGRARQALVALTARTPRIAHRLDAAGGIADVAVDRLAAGELVLVRPGEMLPADGTLADAAATLDESALTGEPLAVAHRAGAALRSGALNAGGAFRLRLTAAAADSTHAAILRLVRQAERDRPPMARLADRWALGFLALTLALCAASWAVSGTPLRALAVLVVATPCPLILAVPVALICGVSRAARRGVMAKGAGALERLAQARIALFDKTGTLTAGTPRVSGIVTLEGFTAETVLRLAASLAQGSQHPVAAALVAAGRDGEMHGGGLIAPAEVVEIPGGGLSGRVADHAVLLGSAGLLAEAGLTPPTDGAPGRLARAAGAAAWVAVDGRLAGAALLTDPLRPEAPRALRALRALGFQRLVMVSGDREETVREIGARLSLDAVHAALSPAGKIGVLRAEQARGPTLMLGDGINDAAALAAADVGVAMGAHGTAAAAEAADLVLIADRLDRLAEAVRIARHSRAIALQSVVAGMALSLGAMIAAALGVLPPVAGAVLQEAIDVAVILNALRALGPPPQHAPRVGATMPDPALLRRVGEEHHALRALLERMRRTAAALDPPAAAPVEVLRDIADRLRTLLLAHQEAEERALYPALGARLGGRDPMGTLTRMHGEIAQEVASFAALVAALPAEPSAAERHEAQRLLHVLDALIALHLSAEEEVLENAGPDAD